MFLEMFGKNNIYRLVLDQGHFESISSKDNVPQMALFIEDEIQDVIWDKRGD